MLDRALPLPILPAWTEYLWQAGREAKLIQLLNNGQGQGYAGWRVLPDSEGWQRLVQAGLAGKTLAF